MGFENFTQRDVSEQMIIDSFDGSLDLSGTVCWKGEENFNEFLLIVTRDSEVNHIETISLDMIKEMIRFYAHDSLGSKNKITLATNIPIDIHSSRAKDLKADNNFHIANIGYSFCEKHGLEFTEMY